MDDLIPIPPQVDNWKVISQQTPPTAAYEGAVLSSVTFDNDPPPCWAHNTDCEGDPCRFSNPAIHGCGRGGTGKLGLCPLHEREILRSKGESNGRNDDTEVDGEARPDEAGHYAEVGTG